MSFPERVAQIVKDGIPGYEEARDLYMAGSSNWMRKAQYVFNVAAEGIRSNGEYVSQCQIFIDSQQSATLDLVMTPDGNTDGDQIAKEYKLVLQAEATTKTIRIVGAAASKQFFDERVAPSDLTSEVVERFVERFIVSVMEDLQNLYKPQLD